MCIRDRTYTLKSTGEDTVYKTGRINNYFGEVDRMYKAGANFTEEIPTSVSPIWLILYNLLPFILLMWFGSRLSRRISQMGPGGGGFMGMGGIGTVSYTHLLYGS